MTQEEFNNLDVESQRLLRSIQGRMLSFEEVNQGFTNNNPFQDIQAQQSFDEITYESKFTSEPPCGEFNDDFVSKVDIQELVNDIRNNKSYGNFFMYYQKYTNNLPSVTFTSPTTLVTSSVTTSVPFTYGNKDKKMKAFFNVKLNKRACKVALDKPGVRIKIDAPQKEANYYLEYVYKDALDKKIDAVDTKEKNDYKIDNKYVAIKIETENVNDFYALSKEVGLEDYIRSEIIEIFIDKLKNTKDAGKLKFLYENLPNFMLENNFYFTAEIPYKTLFEHFNILVNYDTDGFWSGWKDSSHAVINNLRCMSGNYEELLKDLQANPNLVKQAYINLDSSSQYEGEQVRNRTIYAQLLFALCFTNGYQGLNVTQKTFKYGNSYYFDSNVNWRNDKEQNKIFLQQLKKETRQVQRVRYDEGGIEDYYTEYRDFETEVDSGAYYHPLDLVFLEISNAKGETQTLLVPAIFIKSISDEEEWEKINRNIRIGVDIAAVILGLASLGATTGIWAALAVADVALAGADAAFMSNYEEIAATEEGREFLKNWEKIYFIGGLAVATPFIPALLRSGGILLGKVASKTLALSSESIVYIISSMKNALKHVDGFPLFKNNSFDVIANLSTEFSNVTLRSRVKELMKEGVIVTKGILIDEFSSKYILLYKERILIIGNKEKLIKDVFTLFKLKGLTILDKIQEFLLLLRKRTTLVNTTARIGEEATEETIKWGTVKMQKHPDFQEKVAFLKEKNIKFIERNADDLLKDGAGYRVRFVFDKSGNNLLRIEKELEWHLEMRFLDLEHEIDHVIQFETNLDGKFCTDMKKDLGLNRQLKNYENAKKGLISKVQKDFLEFEVRVRELRRLKERNVSNNLIKEHIKGYNDVKEEYLESYRKTKFSKKRNFEAWKKENFPNFEDINLSNF